MRHLWISTRIQATVKTSSMKLINWSGDFNNLCNDNSLIDEAIRDVGASFVTCIRKYLTIVCPLVYKRILQARITSLHMYICIAHIASDELPPNQSYKFIMSRSKMRLQLLLMAQKTKGYSTSLIYDFVCVNTYIYLIKNDEIFTQGYVWITRHVFHIILFH